MRASLRRLCPTMAAKAAGAPAPPAQPPTPGAKKTPILDLSTTKAAMVKSFRLDDVASALSTRDAMFGRKMSQGNMQYFAWPGLDHQTAANAIISMPETIRTCHTIFGRTDVPVDIALDLDGPIPQDKMFIEAARAHQRSVILAALDALDKSIAAFLPGVSVASRVVLQSPTLKKVSFHVHIALRDTAFMDFNSLRAFIRLAVKAHPEALGRVVDLQIYRSNGMLRMHRCMKEDRTCALVVYAEPGANLLPPPPQPAAAAPTATTAAAAPPPVPTVAVPDTVAALHSLIVRDVATIKGTPLILQEATRSYVSQGATSSNTTNTSDKNGGAHDDYRVFPASNDRTKNFVRVPVTAEEACTSARDFVLQHRAEDVLEWKSWINLGLLCFRFSHHFRDAKVKAFNGRPVMDVMLDAWIEASKKAPEKFQLGDCEKTWKRLTPDKLSSQHAGDSTWFGAYKRLAFTAKNAAAAEAEKARKKE